MGRREKRKGGEAPNSHSGFATGSWRLRRCLHVSPGIYI